MKLWDLGQGLFDQDWRGFKFRRCYVPRLKNMLWTTWIKRKKNFTQDSTMNLVFQFKRKTLLFLKSNFFRLPWKFSLRKLDRVSQLNWSQKPRGILFFDLGTWYRSDAGPFRWLIEFPWRLTGNCLKTSDHWTYLLLLLCFWLKIVFWRCLLINLKHKTTFRLPHLSVCPSIRHVGNTFWSNMFF